MEFGEIFQNGILYVGMPIIAIYVGYEFFKLLILSYNEKKNGKN